MLGLLDTAHHPDGEGHVRRARPVRRPETEADAVSADPNADDQLDLGWWVIHGSTILDALRRACAGEDPDLLYAELYANCEVESS
jgi:hypothetical protein